MKLFSTYSVKIKHYNHIFQKTTALYRDAVDFLIGVCLAEWDAISVIDLDMFRQQYVEHLCHRTRKNLNIKYPEFDQKFYKFPSYLRRSAIREALGKVSSYRSSLANWKASEPESHGRKPSYPKAGYTYPSLYRTGMYEQTGDYDRADSLPIRLG